MPRYVIKKLMFDWQILDGDRDFAFVAHCTNYDKALKICKALNNYEETDND